MKKIVNLWIMAYLVLSLASSCHTIRKRIKSDEQKRFQYTQMESVSGSAVRHWYFVSDSAFSYHPDSGLRTFSGRLLGWEFSVNHKLEQQTVDRMEGWKYDEREVMRDGGKIRQAVYMLFVLLAVIFVITCWGVKGYAIDRANKIYR